MERPLLLFRRQPSTPSCWETPFWLEMPPFIHSRRWAARLRLAGVKSLLQWWGDRLALYCAERAVLHLWGCSHIVIASRCRQVSLILYVSAPQQKSRCSAPGKHRVSYRCATHISHTISHRATQSPIH
jgi:hypothetical protein